MSSIDVTLPDELKRFVETEAAAGGYESPGAYVQDVLRVVWRHKEKAGLESSLVSASSSEPTIEATPEFWNELKARVRRRAGAPPP